MRNIFLSVFVLAVFVLLPNAVFAGVRINEIAWMGTATSPSDEWIELFNDGASTVSLNGWRLVASDGSPDVPLCGEIPPGGSYLLERTDDSSALHVPANLFYSGALSNHNEGLSLKDDSDNVVQIIATSTDWLEGNNDTKETMQWDEGDWTTAVATPKSTGVFYDCEPREDDDDKDKNNKGGSSENKSSAREDVSTHAGSVSLSSKEAPVYIYTDAGRDRAGVPEAPLVFKGLAFDSNGKDVHGAEYTWSFGDGSAKRGRRVEHAYHFPGDYNVVLHVESDGKKAVDRIRVMISPLALEISSSISGPDGYIEVSNESEEEVNLGRYSVEGNGTRFVFPKDTIISAGSKIRFANSITELYATSSNALELLFPSGERVSSKGGATSLPKTSTVTDEGKTKKIQEKLVRSFSKLGALQTALRRERMDTRVIPSLPEEERAVISRQSVNGSTVEEQKENERIITDEGNNTGEGTFRNKVSQTAAVADSIVVVKQPQNFWDSVLHFFSWLGF